MGTRPSAYLLILGCAYNSDYKRGSRRRTSCSEPTPLTAAGEDASAGLESPSHVAAPINPNNDDRETIRIDHDSGDASVHAFLQKVSGHLAHVGRGLPRNLFSKEQGGLIEDNQASTFVLPSIETAKAYFDCFFDHANTTYRYLPKAEMFELLNRVYAENETVLSDHTNMAIILLIMGIGCIWTASWRNEPLPPWKRKSERLLQAGESRLEKSRNTFPPTLAILQAQLLKCQLEIASSQFNSAWMTLGWTIRLGQMIDIQREPTSCSPQEAHFRKSVLYAMFMVDRYLAIALGRPIAMQEHEITATLVMELHPTVSSRLGSQEEKLWVGIVAHVRLTMIMGHIVTQLYPATGNTTAPTEAAVAELEKELLGWLSDVPEFFHPVQNEMSSREQAFYDVPPGSSGVNKELYEPRSSSPTCSFIEIFYSGSFYNRLPALLGPVNVPNVPEKFGVDEFKYNATFWMTSHFIFCAISILLVYLALYQESDDWNTIELVVEKAMKFHRKLDNSVNIYAQKLLDESRARVEVLRSLNSPRHSWRIMTESCRFPVWLVNKKRRGQPRAIFREQHAMDTFGMNNGLDMIMGVGFDRAALPETFGIEGIDLFQQYH
uniref:Xylanolytic transcriptional activator regulatory domain-containing protein n=1 Tax=Bionectria ochroleuca TaxID=29856 RepID=A0A8H7K2X0_BIOOC